MGRKLYYEEVEQFFTSEDCELLTKDYKGNRIKLDFICKCGEEDSKSLSAFRKAPYCKECASKNLSEKQTYNYEDVKNDFEANGCKLLSDSYIKARDKLDYICVCGKTSKITYSHFRRGCRCKGCPSKNKYNETNTRQLIESFGYTYLEQNGQTFIASVKFICGCGRIGEKLIKSFKESPHCNLCSIDSFKEKMSGMNNPRWNPNLTQQDREHTRDYPEYIEWKNNALEKSNFMCECCGKRGGDLNVHHKDGYHWCEERRLDPNNAATLCVNCHVDFHSEFGNKNNTEEQYQKFKLNHKSKLLNQISKKRKEESHW